MISWPRFSPRPIEIGTAFEIEQIQTSPMRTSLIAIVFLPATVSSNGPPAGIAGSFEARDRVVVNWYQTYLVDTDRAATLWLLLGFVITFAITRGITLRIRARAAQGELQAKQALVGQIGGNAVLLAEHGAHAAGIVDEGPDGISTTIEKRDEAGPGAPEQFDGRAGPAAMRITSPLRLKSLPPARSAEPLVPWANSLTAFQIPSACWHWLNIFEPSANVYSTA